MQMRFLWRRRRGGGICRSVLHYRRAWRRHHRTRLLGNPFLQFQAEPVLLHFEHGKIVFPHQIDDGFDVFEFHGLRVIEPLGNPRSPSRSRREMRRQRVALLQWVLEVRLPAIRQSGSDLGREASVCA